MAAGGWSPPVTGHQRATNRSIWNSMKATEIVKMKSVTITEMTIWTMGWLTICLCMCYTSLLYSLTMQVTKERSHMKEILRMMGMKDLAFWLSWVLPYTFYAIIVAVLFTLVVTKYVFTESAAIVIFLLICLYGLATVCFSLMLSAILRKPQLTANAGSFIIFFLSVLGLLPLMTPLPRALEVFLSLFHPFSFAVGLAESLHMENDLQGVFFSDFGGEASQVFFSCIYLIVDSVLYVLLTLYFDKVIPDKHGLRHEPFFCLRSSFWSAKKMTPVPLSDQSIAEADMEEYMEKVPAELLGKEAIRIHNIKKTYSGKEKNTEALRGLYLDVYEGQITALLGHNAAGKTTLLNILSGMCRASSGSATIYNHQLSDFNHLPEIQKKIGFCPQTDIMFDLLTVKENLETFSVIKGVPSKEVNKQVEKVLMDLNLCDLQHLEARKLSGGQKRKLTLAIALLGDPEVLLLDEPTAGLDLASRHHVWSMLKERKDGRVTLFSTQFMDEADILADRKAVLSSGRLKCVGSSLFLKRKWGIGYYLKMQMTPSCDTEAITLLIKQHIASAKLSTQHNEDLTFILPFDYVDCFPALFSDLDERVEQDIVTYGVSISTLDDVFLKLEGVDEMEHSGECGHYRKSCFDFQLYQTLPQEWLHDIKSVLPDPSVFTHEQRDSGDHLSSEPEESMLLMSDSGTPILNGMALWWQQVVAMAKIRFLKLKNDMKGLRSILYLLVLFVLPLVIIALSLKDAASGSSWEFTPRLYFLRSGERTHKYYTSLLVNNNTGAPIEDIVRGIKKQDIKVDIVDGPYDPNTTAYNGAIELSRPNKDFSFRLIGNPKAHNGLPVLINIISNTILHVYNSTMHIRVWNEPIIAEELLNVHLIALLVGSLFMLYAPGLAPYIAMSSMQDVQIQARTQLRVAGIFPSAFWLGQALVDITLYWLLLFLMIAILFAVNHTVRLSLIPVLAIVAEVLGYGIAMVLFVYVITFFFGREKGYSRWSFLFSITALIPMVVITYTGFSKLYIFILLMCIPPSTLITFLFHLGTQLNFDSGKAEPEVYLHLLLPYIHIAMFLYLLWYGEKDSGKGSVNQDPVFRFSKKQHRFTKNPEDLGDADEEVLAEKERVKALKMTNNPAEKPAIIVDSLRKEFGEKSGKCTKLFPGKENTKVATRNISFCVKKGEVLGLLGPNGAGKTTTVLILVGEMAPTAGEVVLSDLNDPEDKASPGYCPQHIPLWPNLTMKEHLEIYAAIKGMKKDDIDRTVLRMAEALDMKDHLNKPAKNLSGGVSKKVCFAISMLGNPVIALLDEPSTGLDPKGQQRLWRTIRMAFKNKERGAILTTHYMDEAEAVCDRVAIMVHGKLRCIGSLQHLKSKFGKGYLLEMKMKDTEQVEMIHKEILRLFPQAAKQDRFSTLLVYKIPIENVQSLSKAFLQLENAKQAYNIEEYSFSQSTLAQVFLELTKEQEKEELQESSLEKDRLRGDGVIL
ncbi:ATP-binding cassette sub-family A member 9-like [Gastrophryne carolinensis]